METSLERKRLEGGSFNCTKMVQKLSSDYGLENKSVGSESHHWKPWKATYTCKAFHAAA